jgi:hypothetical protein
MTSLGSVKANLKNARKGKLGPKVIHSGNVGEIHLITDHQSVIAHSRHQVGRKECWWIPSLL